MQGRERRGCFLSFFFVFYFIGREIEGERVREIERLRRENNVFYSLYRERKVRES